MIKNRLSIAEVIGSYLKLEKAGVNLKARCPFHNERTPSFFVSPERGTFHCFGCGKGGDIFTFVEEIEGVEFKEALKVLAERSGVSISKENGNYSGTGRLRAVLLEAVDFYKRNLNTSAEANKYLEDRGVKQTSIDKFQLGFSGVGWRELSEHLIRKGFSSVDAERVGLVVKSSKGYYDRFRGRIIFPFFDLGGRPIGFSARVLPGVTEDSDKYGKYINSPETSLFHKSKVFYGIKEANIAIRSLDKTILVEGQLDVILAHQAGVENAIGVSGTAFTTDHISVLKRLSDNLLVVLDADEAGFRASEKVVRMVLSVGMNVSVVALPKGQDPAELIRVDCELFKSTLNKELPFLDYALALVRDGYKDNSKRENAIRSYLYPVLADTYNEIEKDRSLQDIANLLGVAPDASRRDFEKWLSLHKNAELATRFVVPTSGQKSIPPPLEMVAGRLFGIASMLEQSKDENESALSAKILQDLNSVLGQNTFSALSEKYKNEKREDIVFEVETQYPDRFVLPNETKVLLERLRREVHKFQFSQAIDELRMAEADDDEERVAKSLLKCQEISKKLSQP